MCCKTSAVRKLLKISRRHTSPRSNVGCWRLRDGWKVRRFERRKGGGFAELWMGGAERKRLSTPIRIGASAWVARGQGEDMLHSKEVALSSRGEPARRNASSQSQRTPCFGLRSRLVMSIRRYPTPAMCCTTSESEFS